MAKCKDCGTKTGFLASRCEPCEAIYKKDQQEKQAAAAAEREAQIANQVVEMRANLFRAAADAVTEEYDKFENLTTFNSPVVELKQEKVAFAKALVGFACVSTEKEDTYWLRVRHRRNNWVWLENNRSVLLVNNNRVTAQDHGLMFATDTEIAGINSDVYCVEEHHINVTEAVNALEEAVKGFESTGAMPSVELAVGIEEYNLNSDILLSGFLGMLNKVRALRAK